ncbi:MAG: hypothetical protein OEV31_04025 [Gammaproteobacteria bacterium]|nr:hypothetical protein [Gammaproteobacteria bacterium]
MLSILTKFRTPKRSWCFWLICPVYFLGVASAADDSWSLLLNGKAFHLDSSPGARYNEKNWGAGLQYDFRSADSPWTPFLTASGFLDSHNHPSYYAGGGSMRRFAVGDEANGFHVDVGPVAFIMVRRGFKDGKPFFGMLPVLNAGTDRVSANITYIPRVDPKMVPIIFVQLKIGLH